MSTAYLMHLLQSYGYLAVILFVGLESMGVPLPGESTLIAAALYAGSTHRLNIVAVIAVAAGAAIAGDNLGYAVGRSGGLRFLRRYGHYLHVTEGRLAVGRYLFRRYGGKVVFFGRFVSILRTYAAFLAGVNRMPWRRFLVANAAGGVVWAACFGTLAYLLGNAASSLGSLTTIIGLALTVVLTGVTALLVRRSFARLEARALAEEVAMAPAPPGQSDDQSPALPGQRS